jgi:hypothetical protein
VVEFGNDEKLSFGFLAIDQKDVGKGDERAKDMPLVLK